MKVLLTTVAVLLAATGCGSDKTAATQDQAQTQSAAQAPRSPAPPADEKLGEAIYVHYCGDCHDAGEGHPGTMQLAARRGAEHSVLRTRADLTPDYVKLVVRGGFEMMPAFRPTEIADSELDALADYVTAARSGP